MTNESLIERGVLLKIKNLRINYDFTLALKIPELEIRSNVLGVIGHNGAGKSTLIKALLRLLVPRSGSVFCFDEEGDAISPEKGMAFCPESGSVFSDIPVKDYIKLWCRLKLGGNRAFSTDAAEFIERLDLTKLLEKRGRELSKGQRRRVQTAIGFILKPKLFLFDEPFDGLDVQRTRQLAELIAEKSSETSFIITSHRMDVIERVSDKLLVLNNGEILSSGSIPQVASQLGGETYTVTCGDLTSEQIQRIQALFIGSYIGHSGNYLVITGHNLNYEKIKENFLSIGCTDIRIESARPSLMDAMNFHLSLSTPSQTTIR